MTKLPPPIEVSDRWLPDALRDVASYTFRPHRGERKVLRKRRRVPPSEWAPKHRVITKGPRQGLHRNETVPYAPPVMDAMARAHVETVNIVWPPQCAKSETVNTFAAWLVDNRPGDVLWTYPDEKTSKDNCRDRHQTMITSSKRLSEYTTGYVDDMAADRIKLQHMVMYYGWATSPASLANRPIPYIFSDEVELFPDTSSKKESGPVGLAEWRSRNFRGRRKKVRTSTPNVPSGFLWQALEKTKARFVFYVRCPVCGKWQIMELKRIRVPEDMRDPETIKDQELAWYDCAGCGEHWDDHMRDAAVALGQWRHRDSGIEMFTYLEAFKPKTIAFHLQAWYSPFVSLSEVMAAWFEAQHSVIKLKEFFNAFAAEPWVIRDRERKESAIIALCEPGRPMGIVPAGGVVSCLSFGADTQGDGFWCTINAHGWGKVRDKWKVWAGFEASLAALEEVLWNSVYDDADGRRYLVRFGLIDAMGHRTSEVYDWCRKHPGRVLPSKGEKVLNQPYSYTRLDFYPNSKKVIPGSLQLVRVNTKYFKDRLSADLLVQPNDPGSIRMPEDLPFDYATHYTSEYINEKGDWDHDGNKPNHLWDCDVLSECAAEIMRVRYWPKPVEDEKPVAKQKTIHETPLRVDYTRPKWLEGR